MGLKTFNVEEESYRKYSEHCRKNGISMSKQVDKFIQQEMRKIEGNGLKNNNFDEAKKNSHLLDDKEHGMSRYC